MMFLILISFVSLTQAEYVHSEHLQPRRSLRGWLGWRLPWWFSRSNWVCDSGYERIENGDVPWYGKINGRGGREVVSSCQSCANLCNDEPLCNSYECDTRDSRGITCNLNRASTSTTTHCGPICQRQLFCVKQTIETTSAPTFSPSLAPTSTPSKQPTREPSMQPTPMPTPAPTQWGDWSEWGRCNSWCGSGTESRHRWCVSGNCGGQTQQSRGCNSGECPISTNVQGPLESGENAISRVFCPQGYRMTDCQCRSENIDSSCQSASVNTMADTCIAQATSSGTGIYAQAQCVQNRYFARSRHGVLQTFVRTGSLVNIDSFPNNGRYRDPESTAECRDDLGHTLLGCWCQGYRCESNFDGNTCVAKFGRGDWQQSGSVKAQAICGVLLTGVAWQSTVFVPYPTEKMEVAEQTGIVYSDDSLKDVLESQKTYHFGVRCPEGFTVTGCTCSTPWNQHFPDCNGVLHVGEDACIAYIRDSRAVWRNPNPKVQAKCVRFPENPEDTATRYG